MFHGIDSLRKRGFNRASLLIKMYFSNDVKMTCTSSLVMLLTIVVAQLHYLVIFLTEWIESWIGVRRNSNLQCDARLNTIPFDLVYSNWVPSFPGERYDCTLLTKGYGFKWRTFPCSRWFMSTCTMVRLIPSKKDNKI